MRNLSSASDAAAAAAADGRLHRARGSRVQLDNQVVQVRLQELCFTGRGQGPLLTAQGTHNVLAKCNVLCIIAAALLLPCLLPAKSPDAVHVEPVMAPSLNAVALIDLQRLQADGTVTNPRVYYIYIIISE